MSSEYYSIGMHVDGLYGVQKLRLIKTILAAGAYRGIFLLLHIYQSAWYITVIATYQVALLCSKHFLTVLSVHQGIEHTGKRLFPC